jgi:homocysteine S-methyltransferase
MREAEDGHAMGLQLAQELLQEAQKMIQGVYLTPSYGRYDVVSELTSMLKTKAGVL